jgi:hypothetical protein
MTERRLDPLLLLESSSASRVVLAHMCRYHTHFKNKNHLSYHVWFLVKKDFG